MNQKAARALVVVTIFALLAVLSISPALAGAFGAPRPAFRPSSFRVLFFDRLNYYLAWALVAPGIFWLARRVPLVPPQSGPPAGVTARLQRRSTALLFHLAVPLACLVPFFFLRAALTAALLSPEPGPHFRAEYDRRQFPVAAAALLNGAGARVFAPDDWGDYLIYRCWPRTRVFVDGRSDFYGPAFGERWLGVLRVRPGWQDQLDRYGVDAVLLPPDQPLAGVLKESPRWQQVYSDGVATLFRARVLTATQQQTGGHPAASTTRSNYS
jgi:hypothetical protein